MKKLENDKKFICVIIIVCCVLCGIYYYTQLIGISKRIHSDDLSGILGMYQWIELGGKRPTFSPIFLNKYFACKLFGYTELAEQFRHVLSYLECLLPAFLLAVVKKDGNIAWGVVPIFLFMAGIPGGEIESPQKVHILPILVYLCILLYIYYRYDVKKKWEKKDWVILGLLFGMGITELDWLLFVIVLAPLVIFGIIWEFHNRKFQKSYPIIAIVGMTVLIVAWMFFDGLNYKGGGNLSGQLIFPNVDEILFNMRMFFSGSLHLFNIPMMGEGAIQIDTVFWVVRLVLVLLTVPLLIRTLKNFLKYGTQGVEIVDALLSVTLMCSVMTFIFVGKKTDISTIRYVNVLYYIIPIALCRKVIQGEYLTKQFWKQNGKHYKILIPVFFIICTILYSYPIRFEKEPMKEDAVATTIYDDNRYKNGIGEWWSSITISVLTNWKNIVTPYTEWNSNVRTDVDYLSGYNCYNFFATYNSETENKILEVFGEPISIQKVENNVLYLFDYDIRTVPIHVNWESNSSDLSCRGMVQKAGKSSYMFPKSEMKISTIRAYTGCQRLIIRGMNLKNVEVNCDLGGDEEYICFKEISRKNDELIYEIDAIGHFEEIEITLKSTGDKMTFIRDFEFQRVKNAVSLKSEKDQKCQLINVPEGNYYVTLLGEGANKAELSFYIDGEETRTKINSQGKARKVYAVTADKEGGGRLEIRDANVPDGIAIYIETPYEEFQGYWEILE